MRCESEAQGCSPIGQLSPHRSPWPAHLAAVVCQAVVAMFNSRNACGTTTLEPVRNHKQRAGLCGRSATAAGQGFLPVLLGARYGLWLTLAMRGLGDP